MVPEQTIYHNRVTPNKIIIAGGTGFIGQTICEHLKGYEFVVLCRNKLPNKHNIRYVQWDGISFGDWTAEIENSLAVINLAGRSVDCRHNAHNRKEILESRLNTTTVLGKVIQLASVPPLLWINASSAALYPNSIHNSYDEYSTDAADGFLADVSRQWESAFTQFQLPQTRQVILRITTVLGKNGGMIPVLKTLTKLGLAGKQGSGEQYISWVHELDLASIIQWVIDHPETVGPFNCSSPTPGTNAAFMKLLRKIHRVPIGFPAPTPLLKIGAWILNTEPELVLKSTRVLPTKLTESGFTFKHPNIEEALLTL